MPHINILHLSVYSIYGMMLMIGTYIKIRIVQQSNEREQDHTYEIIIVLS